MDSKTITETQLDTLGKLSDDADNLLSALFLPISVDIHREGLVHGLEKIRDSLRTIYLEISPEEDLWD